MGRIIAIVIIVSAVFFICIIRTRAVVESQNGGRVEIRRKTAKTVLVIALILAGVFFLFYRVFMINYIPSGSMEPTIMTGDVVLSTRFNVKNPERYDIMVFEEPDSPDTYYIKRVIGLPGETIEIKEGNVYANGVLLDSSFTKEYMEDYGDGVYEVPAGCYFMLGDNRNSSWDSRFWDDKYVPEENLVAKAACIIMPFTDFGVLSITHD